MKTAVTAASTMLMILTCRCIMKGEIRKNYFPHTYYATPYTME